MRAAVLWYLVITWYHGGAVAIPEPTRAECLRVRAWAIVNMGGPSGGPYVYCVSGTTS